MRDDGNRNSKAKYPTVGTNIPLRVLYEYNVCKQYYFFKNFDLSIEVDTYKTYWPLYSGLIILT